jgi:hypothetical protein
MRKWEKELKAEGRGIGIRISECGMRNLAKRSWEAESSKVIIHLLPPT